MSNYEPTADEVEELAKLLYVEPGVLKYGERHRVIYEGAWPALGESQEYYRLMARAALAHLRGKQGKRVRFRGFVRASRGSMFFVIKLTPSNPSPGNWWDNLKTLCTDACGEPVEVWVEIGGGE